MAVSSSIRMRRVSAVRPDGPGAAPLRALLKFMRMRSSGRSTGWTVWLELAQRRVQGGVGLRGAPCWVLKFLQRVCCSGR